MSNFSLLDDLVVIDHEDDRRWCSLKECSLKHRSFSCKNKSTISEKETSMKNEAEWAIFVIDKDDFAVDAFVKAFDDVSNRFKFKDV
jgi:hypothetical protein